MRSSGLATGWKSTIVILSITFLSILAGRSGVEASTPATVVQLAASINSGITAYARLTDGRILAWGANESGQLGDGGTDNRSLPVGVVCGEVAGESTYCSPDGKIRGVTSIAAGGGYIAALLSDGRIMNWGANPAAQLGLGDTNSRKVPVFALACKDNAGAFLLVITGQTCDGNGGTLTPFTGARAITAGGFTTYAIVDNGTPEDESDDLLFVWGTNLNGAAGVGATGGNAVRHPYPVACGVATGSFCDNGHLKGVAAVASGGATNVITPTDNTLFALALLIDGRVLAWGDNQSGELGIGNQQINGTPVQVRAVGGAAGTALTGVTAIYADQQSAYALRNGNIIAWGNNSSGQLADGTLANRNVPIVARTCKIGDVYFGVTAAASCASVGGVMTDITGVERFATGGVANLALLGDSTVLAWGANQASQLGDGTAQPRRTPIQVLCGAAGAPGTEFCNDANKLRGVIDLASGVANSYARLTNGSIVAWGGNASGQLGDGTVFNLRTSPIQVSGLDGPAAAVSAGGGFSLVLQASQTLYDWGFNGNGQLGTGNTVNSITPVHPREFAGGAGSVFAGATPPIATGASASYTMRNGRVFAWGGNAFGQLGDGSTGQRTAPVGVVCGALAGDPVFCASNLLAGATAVTSVSGSNHVHALLSDGRVISWGADSVFGRLGDGTTVNLRSSPVEVICGEMTGTAFCNANGKLQGVKAISTGTNDSYAILTDGSALAWGGGTTGGLGNGTLAHVSSPVRVGCGTLAGNSAFCNANGQLTGVTAIAGGANYAVALLADSTLVAWGLDDAGQLGDGTTNGTLVPVRVKAPDGVGDLGGVTAISAGTSTTYALQAGNLLAWGVGGSGQLGHGQVTSSSLPILVKSCRATDGTLTGDSAATCLAPASFEDLINVIGVSGGANYALALRNDGTVLAWGGNSTNQLGIPLDASRTVPGFVRLDLTAPTVTITTPLPGALAHGAIEIAATASDDSPVAWFSCSAGGTALGTSATGSFSATFDTTTLPDGPLTITCSASDTAGNTQSVNHAINISNTLVRATATTVTSNVNPSNSGQPVTFSATVQAVIPGTGTPTGSVAFKDGASTIGTVPLNGSGQAAFLTWTLPVTSLAITAEYSGDGSFDISASPALTQTVNPLPPSIAGAISGKAGPASARQWTITLTDNGPGQATNALITGFTLTQTFGPACTPVAPSAAAFPLSVGNIAAGSSASVPVTIDFTGCSATARFTAAIAFSANAGAVTGSITRNNQFQ